MIDESCGGYNMTQMQLEMPDDRRLALTVVVLAPIVMLGLLCAASWMQPGRRCFRFCRRRDRLWAVTATLLLLVFTAVSAYLNLYLTAAEIQAMPSTELCINFCEVKWGGIFRGMKPRHTPGVYLPEWGSMCSAVFILYCGLHMLIFWMHDSGFLKLVATMFCVNGFSSFFFHMTALPSWGDMDGNSMLLLVWMCAAFMWDEFMETMSQQSLHPEWTFRARSVMPHFYWRVFSRRVLSALIWVFFIGFAWLMMFRPAGAFSTFGFFKRQNAHAIAVAVPLIFMSILAALLTCIRRNARAARRDALKANSSSARGGDGTGGGPSGGVGNSVDILGEYIDPKVMAGASMRLWFGLALCAASATAWVATEQLCDTVDFFKLFPGHVIWHIGMTLGLVNCMVYPALLRSDNFRQSPFFATSPDCLGKLYFALLPGLVFVIPDEHIEELGMPLLPGEGADEASAARDLDMHLGEDPLYAGCSCCAWFCCSYCCCCCSDCGGDDEGADNPPMLSAGAVLRRVGSSVQDWMSVFSFMGGSMRDRTPSEVTASRMATSAATGGPPRSSVNGGGGGFEFAPNGRGGGGGGGGAPEQGYCSTKQPMPVRATSSGARALERARHPAAGAGSSAIPAVSTPRLQPGPRNSITGGFV